MYAFFTNTSDISILFNVTDKAVSTVAINFLVRIRRAYFLCRILEIIAYTSHITLSADIIQEVEISFWYDRIPKFLPVILMLIIFSGLIAKFYKVLVISCLHCDLENNNDDYIFEEVVVFSNNNNESESSLDYMEEDASEEEVPVIPEGNQIFKKVQ